MFSLLLVATSSSAQEGGGSLTDPRDGKVYKTLTLDIALAGGVTVQRTWMTQNLNFEVPDSFCYQGEQAYCEVYGRLYTFRAAIAACPEGWHVPTIGEWTLLFRPFGGIHGAGIAIQKGGDSGIDLIRGGFADSSNKFQGVGISGNYWNAEKTSSNTSGLISLHKQKKEIHHSVIGLWHRNSCRCVKNYD